MCVQVANRCQHIERELGIGGVGFAGALRLAKATQVDGEHFVVREQVQGEGVGMAQVTADQ